MDYKILNDGNKIPTIAFGTWKLPLDETENIVYEAIKVGYRLIDCAESYGNEKEVGLGVKKAIDEGIVKREELFISTKLSAHHINGYENTIKYFYESLERLNIDYLDLYLIHWPNVTPDDRWKEHNAKTWEAIEKLHNDNKIKSIGVSNFMIHHLEELFKTAKIKPVINQLELSPQWQQREVVEFCNKHHILNMAWAPLVHGKMLQNKKLNLIAQKYQKTPAQILLNWNLHKGYIPVCKTTSIQRMKENIESYNFQMENEDLLVLDEFNSHPAMHDGTPDSIWNTWRLYDIIETQHYLYEEKVYLFNFIVLIRIKFNKEQNTAWIKFLNFIPLIKVKIVGNCRWYYLFGIFKFAKKVYKYKTIPRKNLVPPYTDYTL